MPFNIFGANSVSGYTVKNSLRFNSGSSDYLSKTFSASGNRKTWTVSLWAKKANDYSIQLFLGTCLSASDANTFEFGWFDSGLIRVGRYYTTNLSTSAYYRDYSAWYHIVLACDTTQSTASDRMKLYVNGTQVTAFGTTNYPSLNEDLPWTSSGQLSNIGRTYYQHISTPDRYYNGYMSEFYYIDGSQLTPSSFGETDTDTGIWKPKAYTGTYGTNGFYLKFANSASLGTDSSGNGNTWTVNNLTSVDQSTDTPTNNFCTLNPLDTSGGKIGTMTEGNLQSANPNNADDFLGRSTMAVDKGKWYWEVKCISRSGSYDNYTVGIDNFNSPLTSGGAIGTTSGSYAYYANGGTKVNNNSYVSYGSTFTAGDIIGVALDMDNGTLVFYKNGTSQGTAFTSLSGLFTPAISDTGSVTAMTMGMNFGSPYYSANSYTDGAGFGNFSYAVPSGFYSLNTRNLANFG